jgi:DNA-directed RNA polymerase omega subunit
MIEPKIDDLLAQVDSKYTLVTLSAKRAREINSYYNQLGEGRAEFVPPLVETGLAEQAPVDRAPGDRRGQDQRERRTGSGSSNRFDRRPEDRGPKEAPRDDRALRPCGPSRAPRRHRWDRRLQGVHPGAAPPPAGAPPSGS